MITKMLAPLSFTGSREEQFCDNKDACSVQGVADSFLFRVQGGADSFLFRVQGGADSFLFRVQGGADSFIFRVQGEQTVSVITKMLSYSGCREEQTVSVITKLLALLFYSGCRDEQTVSVITKIALLSCSWCREKQSKKMHNQY